MSKDNKNPNLDNSATTLAQYEKQRAALEKTLPPLHPDLAMLYINASILYVRQSKWKEVQVYANKSMSIFKAIVPTNHPHLQKALQLQRDISNPFVALLKKLWHVLLDKIGFGNKK